MFCLWAKTSRRDPAEPPSACGHAPGKGWAGKGKERSWSRAGSASSRLSPPVSPRLGGRGERGRGETETSYSWEHTGHGAGAKHTCVTSTAPIRGLPSLLEAALCSAASLVLVSGLRVFFPNSFCGNWCFKTGAQRPWAGVDPKHVWLSLCPGVPSHACWLLVGSDCRGVWRERRGVLL